MVEDAFKGTATHSLVLSLLGGRVGDDRMEVSGMPQFHVGDRDFLFVARNGEVLCPLIAAGHGRYPVVPSAVDHAAYVTRANHAPLRSTTQVITPLESDSINAQSSTDAQALSVDAFAAAIRAEVRLSGPARRALP